MEDLRKDFLFQHQKMQNFLKMVKKFQFFIEEVYRMALNLIAAWIDKILSLFN